VKQYPSLWVHIDAAWAGVVYALPEYRQANHLDSLNAFADSFSTNMHKWGLVPFDCAPLWVRKRGDVSVLVYMGVILPLPSNLCPSSCSLTAQQCLDNHT
jgi:glutamate/tyrosine decarboxylase-like PLP-dependent enzyme